MDSRWAYIIAGAILAGLAMLVGLPWAAEEDRKRAAHKPPESQS